MAEEEAAAPGKPVVLIAATAVLSAALGAGGAWFALGSSGADQDEVAAEAPAEVGDIELAPLEQRMLALEPLVANITSDGYARLLKLVVHLECETPETVALASSRIPQIRDTILTHVASRRLGDLTSFEGMAVLKEDLRERVNIVLADGRVTNVLLTEFVLQ